MSKIVVIDDDEHELLTENLVYRGHSAQRIRSVKDALDHLDEVVQSDLVVLDLMMPSGEPPTDWPNECRASGMAIYRKLREIKPTLPIIIYTANQDGAPLT